MLANLLVLMSSFLIYNNEGPTYTVEHKTDQFQLRRYDQWIVAQTVVKGSNNMDSEAFHILAGYIFGKNDQNVKIDMTAPVTQQKISENEYLFQFFMPKGWTLETLPKPDDSRINLRVLPQRRFFSQRYVGGWSDSLYQKELSNLKSEIQKEHILVSGKSPVWARYNSPMAPSFLRTNQIMYQVEKVSEI